MRRFEQQPELSPAQVARTVARAIGRGRGARLLRRLRAAGLLRDNARVAPEDLDALAAAQPDDRGLLRLALFGLPGQGHSSEWKNREAIFEQRSAEIMRESRDLESLRYAASRALGHPAVLCDPVLGDMLRSFIAQREAELRAKESERHPEQSADSKLQRAFVASDEAQTAERVHKAVTRIRLRIEDALTRYDSISAKRALDELRELAGRYSKHVDPAEVQRCEEQVERLNAKLDEFRSQLRQLADEGQTAASKGAQERALWIARRLSAVHSLLPSVLPEGAYQELHDSIQKGLRGFETRQVAGKILKQERAIAAEIEKLGAAIHRFHRLARSAQPGDPVYEQAKAEYLKAVEMVRNRDEEWLADLMLELDALLEDLGDEAERAGRQVDRFLENVRNALVHLRREIRAVQLEQQQRQRHPQ
ncbi:MAG: hypothetical protein D6744_18845 [Planctomycetota bacterium]|nr:MAG: hypothetical protein D6744_18845 [Planctomycetota bacterium]